MTNKKPSQADTKSKSEAPRRGIDGGYQPTSNGYQGGIIRKGGYQPKDAPSNPTPPKSVPGTPAKPAEKK